MICNCCIINNCFLSKKCTAVNGSSNVSNGSFTSTKSNVADFDFLKTDNWMNFTSHSQTSNFYFFKKTKFIFL